MLPIRSASISRWRAASGSPRMMSANASVWSAWIWSLALFWVPAHPPMRRTARTQPNRTIVFRIIRNG